MKKTNFTISDSFIKNIKFAFVLVTFILMVNIPIFQNNINSLQKNELSVRKTYDFIQHIEHLLSLTKDVETNQRGYIISKKEEYLKSYNNAKDEILISLEKLKDLSRERSYIQQDLEYLASMIKEKVTKLDSKIDSSKVEAATSITPPVTATSKDLGKEEMDEIRVLASNLVRNEQYNLDHRKEVAQEQFRFLIWSLYLLTILDIFVIALAFHFFRKEVQKRHQLTESLKESENQFRLLSENIPQMVWITTADGGYVYSNPRWREVTGMNSEESMGWGWTNAIHPDDVEAAKIAWINALKTGDEYSIEYRVRTTSSEFRWQLVSAKPLRNSRDEIVKWFGTCTDIHDYKMALEDLRISESKFRKFVDANMIGVVFFELDGKVTESNDAFLNIIGISREEFERKGLDLFQHIAPEYQKDSYIALNQLRYSPFNFQCEKEYISKDGARRPTMIGAVSYETEDGHYSGMAFAFDMSERKKAEEAIENANKAKTQFLANMSHEIRTPLGIIAGFTDLAIDSAQNESERQNALLRIKKNSDLLTELVNDILDLSKIEANKLDLEIKETETIKFLNDMADSMSIKAKEKGLDLLISANTSVPNIIKTDQLRLRQILYNVIGNAIKFTNSGHIKVSVRCEEIENSRRPKIIFQVQDTGIGITDDQKEKLFKPFSQADTSTTRKYGGTGLGLVLSKKLAQFLGGDLTLLHSEPGKGSTFEISIVPGETEQNTIIIHQSTYQAKKLQPTLKDLNILVVEDSLDIQALVSKYLKYAEANIEIANNGKEGLEKALHGNFDLVLMDISMPELDGFEATQKLRESGFKKPIIAMSAHAMKEEKERAVKNGFNDYITKPMNKTQLIEKISFYSKNLQFSN
ncbi:MAG: PAS domain S-box protein [Bdellovibrionota bacterium]